MVRQSASRLEFWQPATARPNLPNGQQIAALTTFFFFYFVYCIINGQAWRCGNTKKHVHKCTLWARGDMRLALVALSMWFACQLVFDLSVTSPSGSFIGSGGQRKLQAASRCTNHDDSHKWKNIQQTAIISCIRTFVGCATACSLPKSFVFSLIYFAQHISTN